MLLFVSLKAERIKVDSKFLPCLGIKSKRLANSNLSTNIRLFQEQMNFTLLRLFLFSFLNYLVIISIA